MGILEAVAVDAILALLSRSLEQEERKPSDQKS
jgi:hypothetical protein